MSQPGWVPSLHGLDSTLRSRHAVEEMALAMQDTDTVGTTAYRAVFEHATDGMLFAAADGRITVGQPRGVRHAGHDGGGALRPARYDDLIDHEDPRWQLVVAERDRTGSSVGVARLRRGDGRYVELETTSRLLHDADGSVRLFSILRDIAGRVEIEREMEELSARVLASRAPTS